MINSNKNKKRSQGFSMIIATLIILSIGLVVSSIISLIVINNLKIARDYALTIKSYYAAEGATEDLVIRLKNNLPYTNSYTLGIGEASVDVSINNDPFFPDQKVIIAESDVSDRVRKLGATVQAGTEGVSFNYAIQTGAGGFDLKNNAIIQGNVYSNGPITGQNVINSVITGDAWAVNQMDTVKIEGTAHADSLIDSHVVVDGYYVNGNISGTTIDGDEFPNSDPVETIPMPVIDINYWKSNASAGGTIYGDYTVTGTADFGPKKIEGNLTIDNNAIVTMNGPIWATGDVEINNNALVRLNAAFGENGSMILSDQKFHLRNGGLLEGSGDPSSYILGYSTSNSLNENNPAIDIENNADSAVFVSPDGVLAISNNVAVRSITAERIVVRNNASVIYEAGLADAKFTSGPTGGWEVVSWKDVE